MSIQQWSHDQNRTWCKNGDNFRKIDRKPRGMILKKTQTRNQSVQVGVTLKSFYMFSSSSEGIKSGRNSYPRYPLIKCSTKQSNSSAQSIPSEENVGLIKHVEILKGVDCTFHICYHLTHF